MAAVTIEPYSTTARRVPTPRELASVCFRHRRLIVLTFCPIFIVSLAYVLLRSRKYDAETEILVKRERADPVVTPDRNASPLLITDVSETDLNSEVELLRSRDLLQKVVVECKLDRQPPHSLTEGVTHTLANLFPKLGDSELAVPRAVRALEKHLTVQAVRKSNLIKVTYDSPDPHLAANVVGTLTSVYLEKHLEVHRPPGTFRFFQQEAARYWDGLQAAERQLASLNQNQNTVSAQAEKAADQAKLADFEAMLHQTRIGLAARDGELHALAGQMASTPTRRTTQVKTNSLLLQQLKSTLLTLELKRTEMNEKYSTSYIPLRNLESEIEQTKAAIANEQNGPLHDDTTDQNSTYQWMSDERAKARTDLESLQRQEAATEQQIHAYRSELLALDRKDLAQQDLARALKVQESNFLLYQNKREEARISDALDQKHIANVSVAEAATTPALPSDLSPLMVLFLGLALASSASLGAAFGVEHFNLALRNPDDVRAVLDLPVLASFPKVLTESSGPS
jgi:uncharacterized protein involved in exopolysaccharide biosynthesis